MKILKNVKLAAMAALALTFTACSDDEEPSGSGQANVEVTDAPVDNAEVEGVFVTITDIKIDGQSAASFDGATTVDLLALQNGRTELLASKELNAGVYNNITFTLDLASDASGNTPGSYVMTSSGKQALEMQGQSTVDLVASGSYEILANSTNNLVVDFDLRKMIKSQNSGATSSDNYEFVSKSEANAALRLVSKDNSGSVRGTVDMSEFDDDVDKVIVYAYKKGTFDAETETQAQGESGMTFANAVSSTAVKAGVVNDSFEINFLEAGEYDIVFAGYSESNIDGSAQFEAFLDTNMEAEGEIANAITIESNTELTLSIAISAFVQ